MTLASRDHRQLGMDFVNFEYLLELTKKQKQKLGVFLNVIMVERDAII